MSNTPRRFSTTRKVRLGDADRDGRLRLDALARYLQDIANDDAVDAGLEGAMAWVLRRVEVEWDTFPSLGQTIELTTLCTGIGSRWAERTTTFPGGRAAALWVNLDPDTGWPAPLSQQFHDLYDDSAAGRTVSSRLRHEPPSEGASRRPWPLRQTDFDALGHVNNTIAFAAVEDGLSAAALRHVEVEYRNPILPDDEVELVTEAGTRLWLTVGGAMRVSARA